jgi:hypothetical protein
MYIIYIDNILLLDIIVYLIGEVDVLYNKRNVI